MDWQSEFQALPDREQEQFSRVLSILFEQTFILRDVWDAKEERLTGNHDYRFAERVRPLLDAYLSVSGWALQIDSLRGVIALYNRFGRNRQSLNRLTTYTLYILRLLYDEQLEHVSGRSEIVIWLRDVYEKLHAFGFVEKKLAANKLQATFMKLRKLSVMDRIEGEGIQPDSRWLIYPTIRMVVSDDRIYHIYDMLNQGEPSDTDDVADVQNDVFMNADEEVDEEG